MNFDAEHETFSDAVDSHAGATSGSDASSIDVLEFSTDEWETLRSERDRYFDALQRSQADFANYRKRADRDQATACEQARLSVLRSMLPLIDAMDQARKLDDGVAPLWAVALEVLAREDVEPIDPAPGHAFDPTVHAALSSTGSCTGSGGDLVIATVLRAGYRAGDQVLRPADVEVTTTDEAPGSTADATSDGERSADTEED